MSLRDKKEVILWYDSDKVIVIFTYYNVENAENAFSWNLLSNINQIVNL